ncbi:MAG: hypothetical protein ACE5JG_07635, partial [Planctomycetota bacterium]
EIVDARSSSLGKSLETGRELAQPKAEQIWNDLSPARPMLAGVVDLHVESGPDGQVEIDAHLRDLAPTRCPTPIDLSARISTSPSRLTVRELAARSEDGSLDLAATGTWALAPGAQGAGLEVRGKAPLPLLSSVLGGPEVSGAVVLEVRSERRDGRIAVAGGADVSDLGGGGPAAWRAGAVSGRFSVEYDPETSHVSLHELRATAPDLGLDARLEGSARDGRLHLTGSGSADLGGLLASLRRREGPEPIAGHCTLEALELARDAGGSWKLDARGEVRDFEAARPGREPLRIARSSFALDASFDPHRNRLVVRTGKLDELTAADVVVERRDGVLRPSRGRVSGRTRLLPALARAFGPRALREVAGELEVGLQFASEGGVVTGRGGATVTSLRLAVDAPDLFPAPIRQKRLELQGEATLQDGAWTGRATLTGDHFRLRARDVRLTRAKALERATVDASILNLAEVRREGWLGLLPSDVELDGDLALRESTVRREGGRWAVAGGIGSSSLTLRRAGRGLYEDPVEATFQARCSEGSWSLLPSVLRCPPLGLEVRVERARVFGPGRFAAVGRVEVDAAALLERFPLPGLEGSAGRAVYEGRLELKETGAGPGVLADGTARVKGLELKVGGESLRSAGVVAVVVVKPSPRKRGVHLVQKIDVRSDLGRLRIDGTVERPEGGGPRSANLDFSAHVDLRRFAGLLKQPGLEGSVEGSGTLSAPLGLGDGRYDLRGGLTAGRITGPGIELDSPSFDGFVSFHKDGTTYREIDVSVALQAKSAAWGAQQIEELIVVHAARGSLPGTGGRKTLKQSTEIQAARVTVDGDRFEGVEVVLEDEVASLRGEDLARLVKGKGRLGFDRATHATGVWQDGRVEIEGADGVFEVTGLDAKLAGGRVTGRGKVDLTGDHPVWEAALEVE